VKGILFNLQRFSIHDGPGIRTVAFLKGCPLRCGWCHNPESFKRGVQSVNGKTFGYEISAGEVVAEALRDKAYYEESGGGVTFSGGEPALQKDFLLSLLTLAKENNLHTCVETCGFAETEALLEISRQTDLILFDYKISDPETHKRHTGQPNGLILRNLKALYESGSKIILRCPVIPGVNDHDGHFSAVKNLRRQYPGMLGAEIMPYHNMGESKWKELGLDYGFAGLKNPDEKTVNEWKEKVKTRDAAL
jgi:pyruvate formate lyase activating enzyme